MIKLITVIIGYRYGVNHRGRADYIFTAKNFPLFPKNIQDALMTGDSRFLREYWLHAQSK